MPGSVMAMAVMMSPLAMRGSHSRFLCGSANSSTYGTTISECSGKPMPDALVRAISSMITAA